MMRNRTQESPRGLQLAVLFLLPGRAVRKRCQRLNELICPEFGNASRLRISKLCWKRKEPGMY
jgi:hypothetical protein